MAKHYFASLVDFSGPGKMNLPALKRYASLLSSFGYNALFLSLTDNYEVKGEPYFGYFKGGYSQEELRELDRYCRSVGIELIPDVQLLGHLDSLFKWAHYWDLRDANGVLLPEGEKDAALLDHIFQSLRSSFSSPHLHIGMDEAVGLGTGKYKALHPKGTPEEAFYSALHKICSYCSKYGFEPILWSDMIYKLANGGVYYDEKFHLPKETASRIPQGASLVYWDYYSTEEPHYEAMISSHQELNVPLWFATATNTYEGFAPLSSWALKTALPGLDAAKKKGIEDIIVANWGDDGYECSYFAALPVLFRLKKHWDGEDDERKIKQEFQAITEESYDGMMAMEDANLVKHPSINSNNQAKWLFYSDPFLGFLDSCVKEGLGEGYQKEAKRMRQEAKRSPSFSYLYKEMAGLDDFLSVKAELGRKTREAYQAKDKEALGKLSLEYGKAIRRLKSFYRSFQAYWKEENKDMGLEHHELRIGALLFRLQQCQEKLNSYLQGEIQEIPELEQKLLDYFGNGEEFSEDDCATLNPAPSILEVY